MKGEATLERPWLGNWPEGVPKSIDYPEIPVHELLRRAAKEFGGRPAITVYGKSTSYRDLDAGVKRFVVCDVGEFLKVPLRQLYPIKKRRDLKKQGHWPLDIPHEVGIHRFADLARTPPSPALETRASLDDVVVLQYTGGTTGTSKGAMLTNRNLIANAMQVAAWFSAGSHRSEKLLGAIPLFHVYGLTAVMLLSVVAGLQGVLYPKPREIGALLTRVTKTKPRPFPRGPPTYNAL